MLSQPISGLQKGHVTTSQPISGRHVTTGTRSSILSSQVGRTELVDQPLRVRGLLDDSLLVVLPDGPTQFVVVHGRTVLAASPQLRNTSRVFNLEDS